MNGYNPDDIVARKGLGIFDKMSRDEQVKASLNTKKFAILATGWSIHSPSPKTEKMAAFVKKSFTDWMTGSFDDLLGEMLSFLKYGYVVAEENWVYEAPYVYLETIKVRAPHNFEFRPDKFGNMVTGSLEQWQGNGKKPLDPSKFIIYTYQKEFDNLYGQSDLSAAYRDWFIKEQLVKSEAMYLEKFAAPSVIAYFEGLDEAHRKELMKRLRELRSLSVATIPQNVKIELIKATGDGSAYRRRLEACDEAISKSILMPNQLGYNRTEQGSNAKAQTQFDVFMWSVEAIRRAIEESIINEQIIKRLCYYNFGEQDQYPQFKFNPLTEKNKNAIYDSWSKLVTAKVVRPTEEDEAKIRNDFEMPERTSKSTLIAVTEQPPAGQDDTPDDGKDIPPASAVDGDPDEGDDKKKKMVKFMSSEKYPVTKNMERVDFTAIDKKVSVDEQKLAVEIESIIDRIAVKAIDDIQNKSIVPKKKFSDIDKFQLKYIGDLKIAFKNEFVNMYKYGLSTWKKEQPNKEFQDSSEILPDEYLDWLNSKAFMEAGKLSDAYKIMIKQELVLGIENGWTEKQIISNIQQQFSFEQVPGATKKPLFDDAYIELICRMNINASFNKARYIQAMDLSEKSNGDVYIMFSEVLEGQDTNSHPFSEFIHGKMVLMGTDLAQRLQYPLHYGDRGVAITLNSLYDDIDPAEVLDTMPDLSGYTGLTIE